MLALVSFQLSSVRLLSLKINGEQIKRTSFQWYLSQKKRFMFAGEEEVSQEARVGDKMWLMLLISFSSVLFLLSKTLDAL